MIDDELMNKFAKIKNLPVSEELLGAYLEGNLSYVESEEIESAINQNPSLNVLAVNIAEDVSNHNIFESDFNFTLPALEPMNDFMIEGINIPQQNVIYEAQKHFGLEPLNVDFDPNIYQWEQDTCAIRSQEIVLRSYGIFVSQDELVNQATAYGWYSKGGGTPMEAVGNLLDLYNVPNHRVTNANVFNLVDELGQGHKVIVGVDVDELYENSFWQSIKEYLVGKTPNHAMIVSGLDTSDPNNIKVILTDPGTGKSLFEIPYDNFLSAWNDSDCFMVATNDPAPLQYNQDTMINFDYEKGHVPFLGKMPFEKFHDEVVPNVDAYLDAIDDYISSLEDVMKDGFRDLDLYEDMMNKADIAHQEANSLKAHNLHEKLQSIVSFNGGGSIGESEGESNNQHHLNEKTMLQIDSDDVDFNHEITDTDDVF